MATKIFDDVALVAGTTMESDPLTSVGDLVLQVKLNMNVKANVLLAVVAKEGDSEYEPVRAGEQLSPVAFNLFEKTAGYRLNIKGVDSESVKIQVTVPPNVAGTITVEATKTENPNT